MCFSTHSVVRALILLLSVSLPVVAQELGTVTFLEGNLRIIRGTTMMRGAEGVRLRRGDIVESSNPGFVQIEAFGGAVVALGPSTRALILTHAAKPAELALLSGWVKGEIDSKAGTYQFASPILAAATHDGTIVLHATGESASIFVESGSANIGSIASDGSIVHPAAAKAGKYFSRRSGGALASADRPDAGFLDTLPRPFRDTLPPRAAKFPKPVEPRPDHEVSYSEVQAWLTAPRGWRRGFVERFQPRLKDSEFRRAADAHVSEHPEWDPILHPEKYAKQNEPATAENPNPQPGR